MEDKKLCPCPRKKCIKHAKCEECRIYHSDKKRPEYCMKEKNKKNKVQ